MSSQHFDCSSRMIEKNKKILNLFISVYSFETVVLNIFKAKPTKPGRIFDEISMDRGI